VPSNRKAHDDGAMEIRAYAETDWEAVREIYDLSKPDELGSAVDPRSIPLLASDRSMLALFRESAVVVAEQAGRVVGFGGVKGNYVAWLFVHPAHRRKGVARALLLTMIGRLHGPITLNVARGNEAARRLYESLGFEVAKEFDGKFNGQDIRVITLRYEKGS
jgi:ribosomal protein S18 acetylase RimI-like enzyme